MAGQGLPARELTRQPVDCSRANVGAVAGSGDPVVMARPRIKPEHAPWRISGHRIRIGGASYGLAAEIEDRAGWIWTLLQTMDGTRTPADIVARVVELHPGESAETVRGALAQVTESGYAEDAGALTPAELTDRDLDRYDRARAYYRWLDLTPRASTWEPQAMLRRARVTVVGVGGTGGVAALALGAAGVGHLHCIDPDVVELSNLSRQVIYTEQDIGAPKANAAAGRLRQLNSDIEISCERLRVGSVADVLRLARGCDVLLLSADQPPDVRVWANRACIAARRPWVDAGYHGPLVQVGTYVPGTGACWECLHDASRDRHAALGANPDDAPGQGAAIAVAAGSVSAGISGYLAAHQVIALLTGVPPVAAGTIQAVNLAALDAPFSVADGPRPACPACGAP
jgi:molybdopterin/thiamine biosynthesis adenylyltransferase